MTAEDVKKYFIERFQNHYASYLTTVEGRHTDDPITMENFKEVIYGEVPSLKAVRNWPAVAVVTGSTSVLNIGQSGIWDLLITNTQFWVFLHDSDPEKVSKLLDRHHEAIRDMLNDDMSLGSQSANRAIVMPGSFNSTASDMILPAGATRYIKGLLVTFNVRHAG